MTIELTSSELQALRWLKWKGGVCEYVIGDKTELGIWNEIEVPGKRLLGKLIKKGLVMLTEEEGEFSPMYDITDKGMEVLKQYIDK